MACASKKNNTRDTTTITQTVRGRIIASSCLKQPIRKNIGVLCDNIINCEVPFKKYFDIFEYEYAKEYFVMCSSVYEKEDNGQISTTSTGLKPPKC